MATFTNRGDYQWQAKVRRKGYPPQSKTFDTKAEAEAWAREIESGMDRGTFVSRTEAEGTTLREGLERYSREITPRKKGAKQELVRIRRWQASVLGERPLASIRGADMAKFRDACRAEGKAENTIRLELLLLHHFFGIARKEWGMESLDNPVAKISLPKGSNTRERRLQPKEFEYLTSALRASSQPIAEPITKFAILTAMRQGEILGLHWDAIDFKKRTAFLSDTKNGDSRIVPLSTKAIEVLKEMARPVAGAKVFNISQDCLTKAFARSCKAGRAKYLQDCEEAGDTPIPGFLEDLRFHDLRHEATSRLFEMGLEIMEVASVSGHKSLAMLKRYTHLRAEELAKKLG